MTKNAIMGIQGEPTSGVKARIEPCPPPAAARATSSACSFSLSASIPPTARTAQTASTITIPIFRTNWKRSMTRTPHRPERVEIMAVISIIPKTMSNAGTLSIPKTIPRIFTMARLTQPMTMQLTGRPR